jgi:hypothetical protein
MATLMQTAPRQDVVRTVRMPVDPTFTRGGLVTGVQAVYELELRCGHQLRRTVRASHGAPLSPPSWARCGECPPVWGLPNPEGWVRLIPPTRRGLYLNVNELDGRVALRVPFEPLSRSAVDPRYQASPFTGNVADVLGHLRELDPRIRRAFLAWTLHFGARHRAALDAFVNLTPTIQMRSPRCAT